MGKSDRYFFMDFIMARNTSRNDIKPVFGFISQTVVILICLLGAVMAIKITRFWEFIKFNSITYNTPGITFICVFFSTAFLCCSAFFALTVSLRARFSNFSTTQTLAILLLRQFCLIAFSPFALAKLTLIMTSKFAFVKFCKLRNWLKLLAGTASFCYDWFRHNVLSSKKNVLVRADRASIALLGLFYYTRARKGVNV